MKGFLLTINLKSKESKLDNKNQLVEENENFQIRFSKLEKFGKDKYFFVNNTKLFLIDGLITNDEELLEEKKEDSFEELLKNRYKYDKCFFELFRGSFRGCVLDLETLELIAFTNQTGEKAVYYYQDYDGRIIVGSDFDLVVDSCKENHLKLSVNNVASEEMLNFGYYFENNTFFNEIKRLTAGHYIESSKNKFSVKEYHKFTNSKQTMLNEFEIIDKLEILFKQSIQRSFKKNRKYNYKGFADLSGGIDSRVINFAAHDLGYNNLLNLCYCQTGNVDEKIARQISKDLGNQFFFQALDNGELIYDIDEMIGKHGGQEFFAVSTGSNKALKKISENIGISSMGLLGEVLKGIFYIEKQNQNKDYLAIGLGSDAKNIKISKKYTQHYENNEIFTLYNYGFHYILSSSIIRMDKTEISVPLMDVDFLEFCLSIPIGLRKNNYIYLKWIHKYYPKSEKYVWQQTMKPLNKSWTFYSEIMKFKKFFIRILNKLSRILRTNFIIIHKDDMNPFVAWMKKNEELKEYINNYYNKNLMFITNKELIEKCEKKFDENLYLDRLLVINLLGIYKRYV